MYVQVQSNDPKAPWLTNKRYSHQLDNITEQHCILKYRLLSPLVAEYDLTIEELNQQISMYQVRVTYNYYLV